MIEIRHQKDRARLRRIALNAQGLLQAQPFGRGLPGARNAIKHLGYVQVDTISVVERAHHHVFFSRVPGFRPAMTNQMLRNGDIFEYWTHAAAFLPIEDFRFSLPYKHAIKNGQPHWFRRSDPKLVQALYERIRQEGPLRSRDLETTTRKSSGWWDWKPAKKALEQLYLEGDLMVCDRADFQKTYDLTERVLPSHVDTRMPGTEEFAAHLVNQQLRCHGLVTLKGITYQRRNAPLRRAVKDLVDEKLVQGELVQVRVANGDVFLVEPDEFESPLPRVTSRMRILSPFDNSVIQRRRLSALFGFDYQIECYLPAQKRRYGYFSLPLLYRDQFVGRMDCKAHRKSGHLEIYSLHMEDHRFDDDAVVAAFPDAVSRFARFQGCESVSLNRVVPGLLAEEFRRSMRS